MEAILEVCRGKRIAFLENGTSLDDECSALAKLFVEAKIKFDCIFDIEKKGFVDVLTQCRNVDVIIYQTTWLYPVSKELKKAFMSIKEIEFKKSFIEIYVNEPTFDSKPEKIIHDMYILNNYRLEIEKWEFHKLREDQKKLKTS